MTVTDLFKHQHLQPQGPTKWGEPIPCALPGVYVVTLDPDPNGRCGLAVPTELPPTLRQRWLPDQPIVYIGKAGGPNRKTTLHKRMQQFYLHKYNARSPHRGGQDVRLLRPEPLWLFWAPTPERDPREIEQLMLAAFKAAAGHRPFGNRRD